LDEEAILKSLAKTKCIVTAEEHNILVVLAKVSRVLANSPAPQEFVAVNDSLENLEHQQLMDK
jgi:transketolase